MRKLFDFGNGGLEPLDESVYGDTPVSDAAQITEIHHERSACLGECPVFEVRFRRDGHASWVGHQFVERLGAFTGTMPPGMFDRLAAAALRNSFFTLDRSYAANHTCGSTITTRVHAMDVVKTVDNYARAAPKRLELFEATLLRAADRIAWMRSGAKW